MPAKTAISDAVERCRALLADQDFRAVDIGAYDLYHIARRSRTPPRLCHAGAKSLRVVGEDGGSERAMAAYHLASAIFPGSDLREGIELAIDLVAAACDEPAGELHATARGYAFDDLVTLGEMIVNPDRTVSVDDEELADGEERIWALRMDAMLAALRHDSEAALSPGCLLCVEGARAFDEARPGEGAAIYCQRPDAQPLELAQVFLRRVPAGMEEMVWSSIDVGVGIERCLMRSLGVDDMRELT